MRNSVEVHIREPTIEYSTIATIKILKIITRLQFKRVTRLIWQVSNKNNWLLRCVFFIDPISTQYDENVALEWIKNCDKKLLKWYGLTVCYYVMYAFQSESTLYSCLNVKKRLARNRCDIWSLSDCNENRTHSHLIFLLFLLLKKKLN